MGEKNKKLLVILVAIIIFIASYAVVTQFQIFEINKQEEERALTAKIFADRNIGTAPFEVNFSAFVINSKGEVDYLWDFGDGKTSEEKQALITYEEEGEYTCSLKVSDDSGKTKEDIIKIVVNRNKPPVVTLSINENTIDKKFTIVSFLALIPGLNLVTGYAGNQQQMLDRIEKKHGADYWGEGRITVTAQVSDPEDDEIVSYEWVEQTGDTLVTFGGKILHPTHIIEGNETITIPELYTWISNEHVVTLTVTDSAGNKANATIDFIVSDSKLTTQFRQLKNLMTILFITTVPQITNLIWNLFPKIRELGTDILDSLWFELPPRIQNILIFFLGPFRIDYEPPIPKADLVVSAINDFDLSAFVNDTTGEVETEASLSNSFTITNNDTENIAKNIYICLYNPFSQDEGLDDELEKEGFIVSIEGFGGAISNKLFYNGKYTNWENCFVIEKLAPGDSYTLDLNVLLKEGSIFNPGIYENCTLYIYQEKSLDIAEYIDENPFTIIL